MWNLVRQTLNLADFYAFAVCRLERGGIG